MFTSRAEYRLLLRHDNADLRLMEIGYNFGLITDAEIARLRRKREQIEREVARLQTVRPKWSPEFERGLELRSVQGASPDQTLAQLLKKQTLSYADLLDLVGETGPEEQEVREAVETHIKYEGYINRQLQQVSRFKKLEGKKIPEGFDYGGVRGFSREVFEKLNRYRPSTLGQASRISGVTPAAISLLLVALERVTRQNSILS